jgi:hypothetical protein
VLEIESPRRDGRKSFKGMGDRKTVETGKRKPEKT